MSVKALFCYSTSILPFLSKQARRLFHKKSIYIVYDAPVPLYTLCPRLKLCPDVTSQGLVWLH